MNRRDFLRRWFTISAVTAAQNVFPALLHASTPKNILVLGGTDFLGPAVVEAALIAGHSVTLFNRGITHPQLFPELEKLHGFRSPDPNNQDLTALAHRHWDVVIDVWPNDPSLAATAAQMLSDRVGHYLYVSSIAAYSWSEFEKPGIDETAPLEPWPGDGRPYNRGKAESERRCTPSAAKNSRLFAPVRSRACTTTLPTCFPGSTARSRAAATSHPAMAAHPSNWST
jgi:hypothetical protein